MRVLVTGGAGYVGSVVVEALLARGDEVVVLDDLSQGHRDAVAAPARFVRGDLLDGASLAGALRGVDAVVHMAAAALVGESVRDPGRYYRQNVVAGVALLDAMRSAGVRDLVFSSTAAVYGEPVRTPIHEGDPLAPANPYGATKLAFEEALRWYGEAWGLRATTLRYFNAAGATALHGERHEPETHLVPLVLRAAATGGEVVIHGEDHPTRDGTCVRDYVHVADLARAHLLALDALAAGRGGRVYNVGSGGEGSTVREVIAAAERVTGRRVRARGGPRRRGDPAGLVASTARIRDELGWEPTSGGLDEIVGSAWRFAERARRAEKVVA